MFELALNDTASAPLAAMPERIRVALSAKAGALATELQAKIQQKLSGEVLQTRSGALTGSIDETSTGVAVCIATSPNVKYAAIHEYGGAIPPYQIVPDKAKALAFLVGGKQAFAARVNLPAITMPERSTMRSSLSEMADEIRDGFAAALIGAAQ